MTVVRIICAIALITVMAIPMGSIYPAGRRSLLRAYVYGLITMWAVTFIFAVPLILADRTLTELTVLTGSVCLITAGAGIAAYLKDRAKKSGTASARRLERSEIIFLGLFLGIVLFQLYKTVFYAYADGDDAYYVAVARAAQVSDRLYRSDPYTGMPFMQAKRYYLAPFPLWIAVISRITGLNASAAAHVAVPLMLIPATYIIYGELGRKIFKDNREAVFTFLCFIAVFALFSGYSLAGAERFMLTRTRQGKEALANIIIPAALLICSELAVKEGDERPGPKDTAVLWVLTAAGALTSFFSNLLLLILIGLGVMYVMIAGRDIKRAILLGTALIPEILMILVYMIL